MDEYKQYRVHMRVRGGLSRPPYEGYVDVSATSEDDAAWKAKQKLRHTSFPDVGYDDMIIKKVERKWS